MPADYHILASIQDAIHMSGFANQMTGRLLDYAQRNDWMGRQITDLGCGTGDSLVWLAQHGYIVTGVDSSTEMLTIAQENLTRRNVNAQLIKADFRAIDSISDQDMVLSLDVFSELNSIREIQQAFEHVHSMLRNGKFFIFDMYTIEGLSKRNLDGQKLEHNADGITIFATNSFDYEKTIQKRDYIIFKQQNGGWQRQEAERKLRAYPIQGITALAQRSGFAIRHVLNMDMTEYVLGDSTSRIIILAEKQ